MEKMCRTFCCLHLNFRYFCFYQIYFLWTKRKKKDIYQLKTSLFLNYSAEINAKMDQKNARCFSLLFYLKMKIRLFLFDTATVLCGSLLMKLKKVQKKFIMTVLVLWFLYKNYNSLSAHVNGYGYKMIIE